MDRNAPGPRPPLQHKPKPKPSSLVRAMYAYDAQDTDELSFKENDRIEVLREGGQIEESGQLKANQCTLANISVVHRLGLIS